MEDVRTAVLLPDPKRRRLDGLTTGGEAAEPEAPDAPDARNATAGPIAALRRVTPLTWPRPSPEGRWWPAAAGRPPTGQGEGGDAGEDPPPGEVKAGEVKGHYVHGDGRGGDPQGRSQPPLGGGGGGEDEEEGDGQSVRDRLSLKGGGGGAGGGGGGGGGGGDEQASGRAAPADDVVVTSCGSDRQADLSAGNVSGVGKRDVEGSGKHGENETMYNAEAWREINEAEHGSAPSSPAAAGCMGPPIIAHDASLDRRVPAAVATKPGPGLVTDDLRGGEGTHAAGQSRAAGTPHKMADHVSCAAAMPAQVPQGPFQGDNDTGPFGGIDPAICSQACGQDGEKGRSSPSAAGVGPSPSGVVMLACGVSLTSSPERLNGRRAARDTMEIPSSSSSSSDQACSSKDLRGETHDRPPSAIEELCFSIITNESLNETQRETHISAGGHAVVPPSPSCPANSPSEAFELIPPGGEIGQQCLIPAGALEEHRDLIEWSPTGPDPLNSQVETKITQRISVKTVCFEDEQLTPVINSPDKIRQHKLTAGTNQQQKESASGVPASVLVSDWFNATMGESCYHSVVLPSLHPEDEPGTDACVLSTASSYRPAVKVMDMIEHHLSPRRTDAVVPGPRCTTHSITYRHDAPTRITQESFQPSPPPAPSALVPSARTPAAVDIFEKIQLSSLTDDDDDDDDCGGGEGPGHGPVLPSSPELWKSSCRLLPGALPGAESPSQREREPPRAGAEPGADAVLKLPLQREETGRRCFDSTNRPWEIPSRASTVSPASTPPVTQPVPATCRVSQAVFNNRFSNAADHGHADDGDGEVPLAVQTFQGFEMKQQFDEVVQELQQFFEIGMSDPLDLSSSDWGSVLHGSGETGAPGPEEDQTTPWMESLRGPSSDLAASLSLRVEDNAEDGRGVSGLMAHGCSPEPGVPPQDPGTCEQDQQVPPADWSPPCQDREDSMYSMGKSREENEKREDHIIHRAVSTESREKKEKEPAWAPSFQSPLSEMQFSQRQTDPHRRLEPLRTCTRPIRVGLSKRAKTFRLHRKRTV